jgi:aspartate-semialdehyde dehydrogenase
MNPVNIAVVGATGLVGEAFLDLLGRTDLPLGQIHALASSRSAGKRVTVGARSVAVRDLSEFDFADVGYALFAVPPSVAEAVIPRAVAAGCTVLDASAVWSAEPAPTLVAADINGAQLRGTSGGAVIGLPAPLAVLVGSVLAPLRAAIALSAIDVVAFRPASDRGRPGVGALARETADVLNAKPRQDGLLSQQIAFNLLPGTGVATSNGYLPDEVGVAGQLRRLLADPGLPVTVTLVEVPVFFGVGAVLRIETRKPIAVERARDLLNAVPGIVLADPDEDGMFPTPVTHSASRDAVFVARLREPDGRPGLVLWALADNIRCGIAGNALKVLRALVAEPA